VTNSWNPARRGELQNDADRPRILSAIKVDCFQRLTAVKPASFTTRQALSTLIYTTSLTKKRSKFRSQSPIMRFLVVSLLGLLSVTYSSPTPLVDASAALAPRQNTGCYCGSVSGLSCGSRVSSGYGLQGDCPSNDLFACSEPFANAQVNQSCLVCVQGKVDGNDSCLLGLPSLGPIGLGR
jgi:hypothetical protein